MQDKEKQEWNVWNTNQLMDSIRKEKLTILEAIYCIKNYHRLLDTVQNEMNKFETPFKSFKRFK